MSSVDTNSGVSGSGLNGRLNLRGLCLIYSSTLLMIAVVYFVVSSVVISPHAVAAPVDSFANPELQVNEIMQTSSMTDSAQSISGAAIPVAGNVNEITILAPGKSGG